ncbi:MAG: hypothetical protein JNK55_05475 [Rubrivivax sp.]|nr:hypothetical protein [Rubrivivax sp.]
MLARPLPALKRLARQYGPGLAVRKLALMRQLARARLPRPAAVLDMHETLCWLRAYPDDAAVQQQAALMLDGFAQRADLRAHRDALVDSGIAGTSIHYRFFAAQAQWLARRWPAQLQLDRPAFDEAMDERLARALPPLLTPTETQALVELKLPGLAALDRLRDVQTSDAAFLLGRIAAMPGNGFTREAFSDALDVAYVLASAPGTPARGSACVAAAPVVFRQVPPPTARPDLRTELARALRRVRRLPLAQAEAVVDLARAAMVTRARSLEAFSFADARDVWLVDDGDGLAFALLGVEPARRHALATYSGGLTLRNGVPIGYVQADIVGRSAALSFNTFETFRGGEAAYTFARWLAVLRAVFGTTSFSIEPYQLGLHNDEALDSGAWWFYAKLGFAPRDADTLRRASAERQRLARHKGQRSSRATLQALAARHLFFDLDAAQPYPRIPLGELGLAAGAALSAQAGWDRERGVHEAATTLAGACGATTWRRWPAGQREAWQRMAPWLLLLGAAHWLPAERAALPALARAKAGRSERDFVAALLAHGRLERALLEWASQVRSTAGSPVSQPSVLPAPPGLPQR